MDGGGVNVWPQAVDLYVEASSRELQLDNNKQIYSNMFTRSFNLYVCTFQ